MSLPLCKFFRSEQGCRFGNKCRYRHSESPPFHTLNQPDHQNQYDGSVRKFYSAETSPRLQENFAASGKYEASVRNHRYSENRPVYFSAKKASDYNEDQVRYTQTPSTAEAHNLEEKFQELEATDHGEGAVQPGVQPTLQQRPQRKVCHYFARNGYCCFGSRCRFEHNRPCGRPPRFQRDGSRSDKDRSSGQPNSFSNAGHEDWVRSSRYSNESNVSHTAADPSKTGSAAAAFESLNHKRSSEQLTRVQRTDGRHDGERTDHRNEGRKQMVQSIKPDKICQFFVRGRCYKGRQCRFLHPRRQDRQQPEPEVEVDAEAPYHEPEEKSMPSHAEQTQESSTSSQGTSAENNHVKPFSKPSAAQKPRSTYVAQGTKKYRRDEVDEVEGSRLRRTEIEQLMKRFPKSKVKVNRDCAEYFQCVVSFSPTDPDWPFDVKAFQLQVDIPSDYPFEMMTIAVPVEQDLPETVRRYLEVSIEEWLEDKESQLSDSGQVELVFRPFLRWLDRNIEDVTTEGLKQLKREMVAKAAGLQFITAKELQKQYPAHQSNREDGNDSDKEEDTDSESQDEDTSSDDDENDEDLSDELAEEDQTEEKTARKLQQDKAKLMMAEPERRGTEVMLKNLQLKESTATLYFEKVCLLIQCERCKATSEFLASPGRVNMVQCGQCGQTQTACYRPAMAHHFSAVVGYLDLDACLPFDLILQKCSAVTACMHCSKDTKSGAVVAGQPQDQWCRVCHHKLRVATDGVRFTQLEPSKTPQSLKGLVKVVVPTRKRIPKDPAIQEGKPLPNFGTCKHYKKSYRWLRFPCCGKCYPCDVCHDSKEDHEMSFANRMICGFCCKEQPYAADRPCKGCDMNMTRVHTKHWEGGQGCRDKITMCRNDKQKYRNASKTVSKHSQKVKDMQSKKRTKLRHT